MIEKEIKLDINGKDYSVIIEAFSAKEAVVRVNSRKYRVGLTDLGIEKAADEKPETTVPSAVQKRPVSVPAASVSAGAGQPALFRPKTLEDRNSILAPLPGQIQKIFIREGDAVKAGQPVMIIEAMKMENEVNAPNPGVVVDIRFREGDSVNQGEVLILLKPEDR
ncbi:MAG TPA: biotin/lipoyl-binding protein [bacterium]|nr:biotin/lipoyl-binding protein [bacterium]